MPEIKGFEKALCAKKFIKNILYSKEEIAVTVYYKNGSEKEFPFSPASGWVGAATGRNPVSAHPKEITPINIDRGNHQDWLPDLGSPQTITVILPNNVHACKKKNL